MQVVTVSSWLILAVLRPREGGLRRGKFWLCLTTAIADSVRLWGDCGGRAVFASLWALFRLYPVLVLSVIHFSLWRPTNRKCLTACLPVRQTRWMAGSQRSLQDTGSSSCWAAEMGARARLGNPGRLRIHGDFLELSGRVRTPGLEILRREIWHSWASHNTYLCQGGYVLTSVSLLVSRITQKPTYQFSRDSVERWHMGNGRNCMSDVCGNPDHVTLGIKSLVWLDLRLKVKVHTLDRHGTCSRGISQFYLHTHTFIRNRMVRWGHRHTAHGKICVIYSNNSFATSAWRRYALV